MNLQQFIIDLFKLYPNSWTQDNEVLKKRQYFTALNGAKIDYSKLMDCVANEHIGEFLPTPAWLKEKAVHCYTGSTVDRWLHVKVFDPRHQSVRNIDCFPKGTKEEDILKTYESLFKCTGWKIMEIY